MCRATLARPVGIIGLVGRYPANYLIPRRPVPRRRSFGPQADARPRTSLGITRSFPRLYPTMGLVTVALLTLPPLARSEAGPVRLACLIHAANVHSEPGSNPSKMSRSPASPAIAAARPPAPGPHPKGLRKTNWSHRRSIDGDPTDDSIPDRPREATRFRSHPPHRPTKDVCRSLRAIPTPGDLVDPPGRASSDDRSHAGFPQGFLTRRILTFVSLCLADECHRPNCQRASRSLFDVRPLSRVRTWHPESRLAHFHSTPSAGARCL